MSAPFQTPSSDTSCICRAYVYREWCLSWTLLIQPQGCVLSNILLCCRWYGNHVFQVVWSRGYYQYHCGLSTSQNFRRSPSHARGKYHHCSFLVVLCSLCEDSSAISHQRLNFRYHNCRYTACWDQVYPYSCSFWSENVWLRPHFLCQCSLPHQTIWRHSTSWHHMALGVTLFYSLLGQGTHFSNCTFFCIGNIRISLDG